MLSLSFAKLVATPTDAAWSQVYNAGNLFASLSLTKEPEIEEVSLSSIGKEIIANLEAEFFTLEDKNLANIKEAILTSVKQIPQNISVNLCLAYFKNDILYIFIFGEGAIIMKRSGKIGTLLEKTQPNNEIVSASGYLENGDTIVLQTPQFAKDISKEALATALELPLPNDIAEALSPGMHEKDDGGHAAIIISYQKAKVPVAAEILESETPENFAKLEEEQADKPSYEIIDNKPVDYAEQPQQEKEKPGIKFPAFFESFRQKGLGGFIELIKGKLPSGLNHRKKLYLSIAVILLIILALSILLTKKKEENTQTSALFQSIYNPSLKYYQDGVGVKSINSDFAHEDFLKAEKILKDGDPKFKKGSNEEKQISDLLSKVESELGGGSSSPGNSKTLDRSKLNIAVLNGSGVAGAAKGISDYLSGLGYTIQTTGNADKYDYKNITIQIKKSANNYLPLLKKDLSEKSSSITTSIDDNITTDAVVIVGK